MVDDDDSELFREAIGPVRPLPATPEPPAPPKPRPRALMAERDEDDARGEFVRAMDEPLLEAGDALVFEFRVDSMLYSYDMRSAVLTSTGRAPRPAA